MTLTALMSGLRRTARRPLGKPGIRRSVKCCSSWQSSGCSTHDGAPPKDRRCHRRRGARLSASVRDQGRCELELAFAARDLASARATSAAR